MVTVTLVIQLLLVRMVTLVLYYQLFLPKTRNSNFVSSDLFSVRESEDAISRIIPNFASSERYRCVFDATAASSILVLLDVAGQLNIGRNDHLILNPFEDLLLVELLLGTTWSSCIGIAYTCHRPLKPQGSDLVRSITIVPSSCLRVGAHEIELSARRRQ